MKAVILAGGKGTRLGSLTTEIPKPMITIGNIPLLHHQINLLVKYGFSEIILLVNYLSQPIRDYFGDGTEFGVSVTCLEEPEPLGTTGGLKEIEDKLTDDFLVLYGDVMINMNLERLIRFHNNKLSQCTLVLHPNDHPYDSDLVEINEDGRVLAFHSKPHETGKWYHNMVNAGAYIFSPVVLNYIAKGKKADFGRDIFPEIIDKLKVFGYHTSEYLKDMGTPGRLLTVKDDFNSGKIEIKSYEYPQKAIFLDRDGVLNVERSFISRPQDLEIFDFAPPAVKKINNSEYLAVVVTNQSAIARNLCTEEDVRTIHKKLETELGEHHAWIDAIYYCPHHPDKGFPEENPAYKIVCDCRKPAIGMFKKAIDKFHIDPQLSYMIGDSERDIQAGINAGCITVGVRTGYGIRKTSVYPDYMFENLKEAVDFITEDRYKSFFDRVNTLYSEFRAKLPWVILIGGNSRSGKSTLATYLRINFEKSGKQVLQVSLDNWIIPEHDREASMNVYDRYRLIKIQDDITELLKGKAISVRTYTNHPQGNSLNLTYDPVNVQVIIIEGVTALSSAKIRDQAHLKIYTRIDNELFIQRINEFYGWRGKTADEIAELVKKREIDEYQLIEKESKLADLIINSAGA